jgi:hypothetical protein
MAINGPSGARLGSQPVTSSIASNETKSTKFEGIGSEVNPQQSSALGSMLTKVSEFIRGLLSPLCGGSSTVSDPVPKNGKGPAAAPASAAEAQQEAVVPAAGPAVTLAPASAAAPAAEAPAEVPAAPPAAAPSAPAAASAAGSAQQEAAASAAEAQQEAVVPAAEAQQEAAAPAEAVKTALNGMNQESDGVHIGDKMVLQLFHDVKGGASDQYETLEMSRIANDTLAELVVDNPELKAALNASTTVEEVIVNNNSEESFESAFNSHFENHEVLTCSNLGTSNHNVAVNVKKRVIHLNFCSATVGMVVMLRVTTAPIIQ